MEFSHKSAVGWLSALWTLDSGGYILDTVKATNGPTFTLSVVGFACSAILAVAAFLQWRKM